MRLRISGKLALVVVIAALAVAWLWAGVTGRRVCVIGRFPGPPRCPFCGEPAPGPLGQHRQDCSARPYNRTSTVHSRERRGSRRGALKDECVGGGVMTQALGEHGSQTRTDPSIR